MKREQLANIVSDLLERWDAEDPRDALWQATYENDWSLSEFLGIGLEEAIARPSVFPRRVEIFYQGGDKDAEEKLNENADIAIIACQGRLYIEALQDLEEDLRDNGEFGEDGIYLGTPEYEEGDSENPGGWYVTDLTFLEPIAPPREEK